VGSRNRFNLSAPFIMALRADGLHTLAYACAGLPQLRGRAGWKSMTFLDLPADITQEWDDFLYLLCGSYVTINPKVEDSLCWSYNSAKYSFTVKLGYKSWKETHFLGVDLKWWWKPLWKFKASTCCKLTFWLALNNKLLIWENNLKRGWIGLGRCPLCKLSSESIVHLFISCSYPGQVTMEIKHKLGEKLVWNSFTLGECYSVEIM
jgi:hypothetical protein